MERSRTNTMLTLLDGLKSVNLNDEYQKVLKEKEKIIKTFEDTFIYEKDHSFKKNIKIKFCNYLF